MIEMHSTRTRRPHARQLAVLAAVVALLLALATAVALRQATATRPASRAPAASALAHDGYAPTGLDYREDHRSDGQSTHVPSNVAIASSQQQRPAALDALFYGPAAAHTPDQARQQQQPARLDAMFYGPAAPTPDPRAIQQRQRPAWLDARDYGLAAGGAPPPQDGSRYQGPR